MEQRRSSPRDDCYWGFCWGHSFSSDCKRKLARVGPGDWFGDCHFYCRHCPEQNCGQGAEGPGNPVEVSGEKLCLRITPTGAVNEGRSQDRASALGGNARKVC